MENNQKNQNTYQIDDPKLLEIKEQDLLRMNPHGTSDWEPTKPISEVQVEDMSPVQMVEWLAVHITESSPHYTPNETYYKAYLAANGNERAYDDLANGWGSENARIMALLSGDPKYLDRMLASSVSEARSATAIGGRHGRSGMQGAEGSVIAFYTTASQIGAKDYAANLIKGYEDGTLNKERALKDLEKHAVEPYTEDERSHLFSIDLTETEAVLISDLTTRISEQPDELDDILSAVETLERLPARVMAYNRIAQTLKANSPEQLDPVADGDAEVLPPAA